MLQDHLPIILAITALLLITALTVPAAPDYPPEIGSFGSTHIHASLFFLTNGTRKPLTNTFIQQDSKAHFHADDGIIHIEARNVDLDYTLDALNITLTSSCLTFTPDNTSYCTTPNQTINVIVNQEQLSLDTAGDYIIQQDDSIVIYHGPANATIPRNYLDRELPEEYRPDDPGQQV